MKNFLLLLSFIAICFQQTQAQIIQNEKRHFVSLNVGLSNPIGDYGSTSSTNDNAGLAKSGVNFNAEGAFYFKPYLGIAGNIGFFVNKVDQGAFQQQFTRQLNASGFTGTYAGTVGTWLSDYIMVGPCLSLPLKDLTIDFKLQGGLMTTIAPAKDITLTPTGPGNTIHEKSTLSVGAGLGYNLGLALRYELNPHWALRFSGNYITANPKIDESMTTTNGNQSNTTTTSTKQPIAVLNLCVGAAYQFGKR